MRWQARSWWDNRSIVASVAVLGLLTLAVSCSQDEAGPEDTVRPAFGSDSSLADRILRIEEKASGTSVDESDPASDHEDSGACGVLQISPEMLSQWALTEEIPSSESTVRLYNDEDGHEIALMSRVSMEVLGGAFERIGLVELAGHEATLETAASIDPALVTTRAVYIDDNCGVYGISVIGLSEGEVRLILEEASLG